MQKFTIKYDLNDPDPPKPHELHAAKIVADYFQSDLVHKSIVKGERFLESGDAHIKKLLVIDKMEKVLVFLDKKK